MYWPHAVTQTAVSNHMHPAVKEKLYVPAMCCHQTAVSNHMHPAVKEKLYVLAMCLSPQTAVSNPMRPAVKEKLYEYVVLNITATEATETVRARRSGTPRTCHGKPS